jgi:hypothetical protein
MANNEVLSAQTFAIGSAAKSAFASLTPAAETPGKAAPARTWTAPAVTSRTARRVLAVVAADEDVAAAVVVAPTRTSRAGADVVAATPGEDDFALAVAEPVGAATYDYGHTSVPRASLAFDTKWWDDLMAM